MYLGTYKEELEAITNLKPIPLKIQKGILCLEDATE
jgi:hypothetical protein